MTMQKNLMTLRKHLWMPPWALVLAMAVYDELLLHLWTNDTIVFHRLAVVVLFALGLGGILALLVRLVPDRAGKAAALAVSLALTLLCMLEYGIQDSFQMFMSLSVVAAGAGGVAADFSDTVVALIRANVWRIVLLLAPMAVYLFCRHPNVKRPVAVPLAAATAAVYVVTMVTVALIPGYAAGFRDFSFDSAVRDYGLHVALVLDGVKDSENASFADLPTAPQIQETQATDATAPTDASEAPTEAPVVYTPQVLDIDFSALAERESKADVAALHRYVASRTPAMTNEYTGLFSGKNLILITAEAFTGAWLSPELTPTLWRLVHEGIYFSDYYQPLWGASTTGGEYSNVVGLVPGSGKCMQEANQQDLFLTMGNQLQALGYSSAAYHNNSYTYYSRHETHTYLGYDTFMGMGNGMEAGVSKAWPQSDVEMIDFTISKHLDNQPFSLYYMSVSGHSEYSQGGNDMSRKNYSIVADMDASEAIKCYIAANLELEYAMAHLVQQLEEAGIADDTVIVLSTDHYPYGLEWDDPRDVERLYGYKYTNIIERDHSALIMWSGCIEDMDLAITTPTYSLDILPTLSNLFGLDYDSRLLVGRDVFSEQEPIVLWYDHTWKTDKGYYVAEKGKFYPNEGVEIEDGYVERIAALVSNKIVYSREVAQTEYFTYVSKAYFADK